MWYGVNALCTSRRWFVTFRRICVHLAVGIGDWCARVVSTKVNLNVFICSRRLSNKCVLKKRPAKVSPSFKKLCIRQRVQHLFRIIEFNPTACASSQLCSGGPDFARGKAKSIGCMNQYYWGPWHEGYEWATPISGPLLQTVWEGCPQPVKQPINSTFVDHTKRTTASLQVVSCAELETAKLETTNQCIAARKMAGRGSLFFRFWWQGLWEKLGAGASQDELRPTIGVERQRIRVLHPCWARQHAIRVRWRCLQQSSSTGFWPSQQTICYFCYWHSSMKQCWGFGEGPTICPQAHPDKIRPLKPRTSGRSIFHAFSTPTMSSGLYPSWP